MASTSDLCWNHSKDLFSDVDLDSLFELQQRALGGENCESYPYLILLHTGKITIGIDLGNCVEIVDEYSSDPLYEYLGVRDDPFFS